MKDNCPTLMQSEERVAPWNQEESLPVQIDCTVCYCMSKSMPIEVEDYDEGTNLIEEFEKNNYSQGIPALLKELNKLCREKIERLRDELRLTTLGKKKARKELEHCIEVLRASQGWIVDDLDVCEE